MAAVYTNRNQTNIRSSSDPFVDPYPPPGQRTSSRPPPLPPKSNSKSTKMAAVATPRDVHRDISEAVRDTVTVRANPENPRTRMGRSQTQITPSPNSSSRPAPGNGRRSQSQDSVLLAAAALEKNKSGKRSKKGSQHADVIDRLDYTGVGLFHHDGPFDACAPSRNRHRTKAPMLAWSSRGEEPPMSYNDNPYPSADAYKVFSNTGYEQPKKKVDAIAEAWGIHEPEPFEEFFAGGGVSKQEGDTPASSIHNGRTPKRSTNSGRDPREVYKEYLDEGQHPQAQAQATSPRSRAAARRSVLPPPQPIFVPDPSIDSVDLPVSSPGTPGAPKRTKSLMHRIRKMRETPNVPVDAGFEEGEPPSPHSPSSGENAQYSPNASRPTHRTQNSFLGRFGGGSKSQPSPTSENPESYVYIEDPKRHNGAHDKDLPATPAVTSPGEATHHGGYFEGSGPSSPGLGRKTSLMRKVRGVVRSAK